MKFLSTTLFLLPLSFTAARINSPGDREAGAEFSEGRYLQQSDDLGIRFSKVAFPPDADNFANQVTLPLTADDFKISSSNNDLLDILKESICPSVTKLDDYEIYFDVLDIIEGDFVGGYPTHASNDLASPFWGKFREVAEVQALRRVDNGSDPAIDLMPLPEIWNGYSLDAVAEAVHDEYPNYHQAKNLARMLDRGQGVAYEIDDEIIPQRSAFQFLRGPVMIADMNTWGTSIVGPHSFSAKFAVGRARPEETAWSIKTGGIPRQYVPSDIFDMISDIPDFNAAVDFTAYDEGSPRHPSWPAMHSAASQTSFWLDIVLDLTPEELCQARLTDYGVAYARTVAGVHYPDDNIDGLNIGQEVIALALPGYLSLKYGADEQSVRSKIEEKRFNWNDFDPQNPCPFVANDGDVIWTRVTGGRVRSVDVYKDNIYAVGFNNKILKQSIDGIGSWENLEDYGGVASIDVYEGYIYAVGFDENVWKLSIDGTGSWSRVNNGGSVTDISVYDDYIYGVGSDTKVYKHHIDGTGSWTKVENNGGIVSIDVYDGYVYGVGFDSKVYKYNIDGTGSWSQVEDFGNVASIDVYEGYIYAVGFENSVWKHKTSGFESWEKVSDIGSVTNIALYQDNIYGVLGRQVWRRAVV